MIQILKQRQRRLIAFCVALIVLNVLIFGIAQFIRSNRSKPSNEKVLSYGDDISVHLHRAGLKMEPSNAMHRLLILLGDTFTDQIGLLMQDIHSLKSKGIDVKVITKKDHATKKQGRTIKNIGNIQVIVDHAGEIFQAFGLSEQTGHFILYLIETAQTISTSLQLNDIQAIRDELLKLSLHPMILQKPLVPSRMSQLSGWEKRMATFPFDSLINHANDIIINLDELPQKKLKLIKRVGNKEYPVQDEPMFARPLAIAPDQEGPVFVCDGQQNQVFVLNRDGVLINSFGRKGQGPGEFCSPVEIVIHNNRIFVADVCLRIHEFDMNLQFIGYYKLDSEIPHFSGFGLIGEILIVPYFPMPPQRKKIFQVYGIQKGQLNFITSFFDYFKPTKRYSNQMSALLSFNENRFTTDGRRYVAFGRPHQTHFFVLDLEAQAAYKYQLQGRTIEKHLKWKKNDRTPDFAVLYVFKELVLDKKDNLYILIPNGILEINISSNGDSPNLYKFEPIDTKYVFGGYDHLAVSNKHFLLLSSYDASMTILK